MNTICIQKGKLLQALRLPRQAGFYQIREKRFLKDHISIDATVGEAFLKGYFPRSKMLCTKTIYNYIQRSYENT